MNAKLLFLFPIILLVGCSTTLYEENIRFHQIAANAKGSYQPNYKHQNNSLDLQCKLNEHLSTIIENIKKYKPKDEKRKVLISIHGGLNTQENNYKRVKSNYAMAMNEDGYYPIFVNWRSGALATLKDRYFRIRNGREAPAWITTLSAPLYLASDVLSGVAALPEAFWDQGANFTGTHLKRLKKTKEGKHHDEQMIKNIMDTYPEVNFHYTQRGNEKSLKEQAYYATNQVIPGLARIISTPFVEGNGRKVWPLMLRQAKLLIYRDEDLAFRGKNFLYQKSKTRTTNLCENDAGFFLKNKPNGIVAQLMRAIQQIDEKIEITLVGHSMGVIIANDIIKEFPGNGNSNITYGKIIHMASADSIQNLVDKLVPFLDKHPNTKFYNLSLHPVNEEQEQSIRGIAPEGSLLVWLDYFLTNPATLMDRRAGRWDNIKLAFPFFKNRKNMHFKLFGLRKDQAEPIKHGDFDDGKFWREDFYWGKKE